MPRLDSDSDLSVTLQTVATAGSASSGKDEAHGASEGQVADRSHNEYKCENLPRGVGAEVTRDPNPKR